MSTRLVRFIGGKGGVGKTTLSAALALRWAREGWRTLVVSTDPAHSLGDALQVELGDRPREVADGLWAAEVSGEDKAGQRIERIVTDAEAALPREIMPAVRRHLERAASSPGTVEAALLDRVNDLVEEVPSRWDRLVVDSAPTGHMLRLLSLPTLLTPWIEGLASQRKQARSVDRLVAGMGGGTKDSPDPLLDRLHERRHRLERLASRLTDDALVHLVTAAERLPFAETERAADSLAKAGIPLGQVLVNRVLPAGESGLLGVRREHEDELLQRIRTTFAASGIVEIPLLPGALTDRGELTELGDLLGDL